MKNILSSFPAALLLAATALAVPAFAEDANEAWKKQMESKIEALSRELESRQMAETVVSTYTSTSGMAPSASKVYHVNRGVSIGGYGEFLFRAPNKEKDDGTPSGGKRSFDALRAVLYTGYKFTDKILFNSELEFEHATTGEGDEERGEVSVEFAYLDFLLSRPLSLRAGLLLVPMGFINEMHEPTTFHGSNRPSVERNIIPSTWRENGLGIHGEAAGFAYRSYLLTGLQGVSADNADGFSGGSAIRGGRTSGSNSLAEDFAWVGRVDYTAIPGVMVGGSLYTGQAGQSDTSTGQEINGRVSLWETHTQTQWRGLELRGLYAQGTVGEADLYSAANSASGSTVVVGEKFFGGYAEVAYDVLSVLGGRQYLAPFFRYERYDTQQRVPSGLAKDPANSRVEYTVGLTYKPIPNTVIKADWQDIDNQAGTGTNQVNVALGYAF